MYKGEEGKTPGTTHGLSRRSLRVNTSCGLSWRVKVTNKAKIKHTKGSPKRFVDYFHKIRKQSLLAMADPPFAVAGSAHVRPSIWIG